MTAFRSLPAPPDLLSVHASEPARWPFLLDSASEGGRLSQFSMLLRAADEPPIVAGEEPFLPRLAEALRKGAGPTPENLAFEGGWFVYLGYELAAEIEPRLPRPPAPDRLPTAYARRCRGGVVVDRATGCATAFAEDDDELDRVLGELAAAGQREASGDPVLPELELQAEPGQRYLDGVRHVRECIAAGDVYQVNLSRAWTGRCAGAIDSGRLYRRLTQANPAPFAGLARLPGGTILSSSPERLVSVRDGRAQTRPIAGTRPRGRSESRDRELSDELLGHPKERAEHVMLIDLERNDLGRVCRSGSVEVDELMVVESYAHVHHIVSNVRGTLRDGVGPAEVIAAVFPGGTITGCPKVRCMEIIAALERQGRSFYTGSMGYVGRDGSMDLNILIRSMLVDDDRLTFRTGAGIVADSDPEAELRETEAKAEGLLRALTDA
ncbi:MAG: aminodeoxychorismate synthase component I [Wenzhouxiangellaceae bacterium]|nr:aminodeoxychorismate synthase component I [Wenzhouxiangellaceae bacterium]